MASVLIVDDSPEDCQPLAAFLERAGHAVTCMTSERDALAHVLAAAPDVVLLDLMTPDLDGAVFLGMVRSYRRFAALPVVVLTGQPEGPLAERARALNVNAILVKGRAELADVCRALESAVEAVAR